MLSGCWDMKTIQDIDYLTALGFDYRNGQYIVYVQMLDFASVAKTESGKPTQPTPIWVGTGQGITPAAAINDLYRTSQLQIFYGQISTLVISENVMKQGLEFVSELPRRYSEMRYTPWVFGTKQPISELFSITPFFNLSPMTSLLHQPQESYRQESRITPVTLLDFAASFPEPGKATLLPSLSMSEHNWMSNQKPNKMLVIDGIFAFQDERYRGWLDVKDVNGLRWTEPKTIRSPLQLQSEGKIVASVSLEKPQIQYALQGQIPDIHFKLKVKLVGNIVAIAESVPESKMEQLAAEYVEDEIKSTFVNGLRVHADLLQLEHFMYRKHNREWKRWRQASKGHLQADTLADVQVKVHMEHAGKLKY